MSIGFISGDRCVRVRLRMDHEEGLRNAKILNTMHCVVDSSGQTALMFTIFLQIDVAFQVYTEYALRRGIEKRLLAESDGQHDQVHWDFHIHMACLQRWVSYPSLLRPCITSTSSGVTRVNVYSLRT